MPCSSITFLATEISATVRLATNGFGNAHLGALLVQEIQAPPGTQYCSGSPGTGTPCPCNNDNDGTQSGAGCANGFFPSGARLNGDGIASVSNASLVLTTRWADRAQVISDQSNSTLVTVLALRDFFQDANGGQVRVSANQLIDLRFERIELAGS